MKDTLAEFLEDCRWVLKEYSDHESGHGLSGIKGDCSSVNSELENTEIVGNDDEMVEQILQDNTKLIKKDHESADGLSGIKGDCSSVNSELENTEIVGNDDEMVEQILQDNTKLIKKFYKFFGIAGVTDASWNLLTHYHESADGLSGIKGDCSSVNSELENTEIVGNDDEMVEQILQDNTKLIKKDHESADGLSGIKGDCSSVNSELENTEIVGNDDEMVEQILQDNTKLIKKFYKFFGIAGVTDASWNLLTHCGTSKVLSCLKEYHESADGLSGIKGDCSSVNSELENTEIVGNDDEMVEQNQILQDNTKLIKKDHESADGLSGIKGDYHESEDGLSGIKGDCSSVNSEIKNTEIVVNDVSDDDQIKDPDYMPWEEESIPDSENEWEDLDTIMKYLPELSFQALDSLDDEHLEGIVLENSKDFINQTDVLENSFDIVDQIDELKKKTMMQQLLMNILMKI
ncbi:unnamed protein product [Mytilus edulis]|uniref:Uncharacterized protein n=1 Tax=Mytilus edulis TaxID=6550 RepID=A0A8S3UN35_MYTED|nr:unnamed protein product [Mytilus edulis]